MVLKCYESFNSIGVHTKPPQSGCEALWSQGCYSKLKCEKKNIFVNWNKNNYTLEKKKKTNSHDIVSLQNYNKMKIYRKCL